MASEAYWLSLAFTFVGAALFTFARTRRSHIPLEAFIGIAYAVASAIAILAMSKATGETEHLKDMLVGNILAISMHDVVKTAVLYGAIGVFHYIFRKQFLLISTNPAAAEAERSQDSSLGFSVLRIIWLRGDFIGRDCGRLAGVLLPGGSVRRRHVVCGQHRTASCNRLDYGDAGVGAGHLFFRSPRLADRCDDRLHIWSGADRDVLHPSVVFPRTPDPVAQRCNVRRAPAGEDVIPERSIGSPKNVSYMTKAILNSLALKKARESKPKGRR